MKRKSAAPVSTVCRRWAGCLIGVLLAWLTPLAVAGSDVLLREGEIGFVVSAFRYALGDDATALGTCKEGMSRSITEVFMETPAGQQGEEETDEAYARRMLMAARSLGTNEQGVNVCQHPEQFPPDPSTHTVHRSDIPAEGIDLDALTGGRTPPAQCAHTDFLDADGHAVVDNQFYRTVGCSRAFQSTGMGNSFQIGMYAGEWGILIALKGVDDLVNDDRVEVGIYASADPMMLSPGRDALRYATYAIDQDPRFRANTVGRISDGVLTTEPVDVRFHHAVNSIVLERPLRAAVLQASISDAGELEGWLGGYAPVEALYDHQYGYRSGKDMTGQLASERLRTRSSNGAAHVMGHSCAGVYHALYEHADAFPDPATGRCTAISTQYRVSALPAFIVDVESQSLNKIALTPQADP